MTKLKDGLEMLRDGLLYSWVECLILIAIAIQKFTGDGLIAKPFLWAVFLLTAVWVLATSTKDAEDEAKMMVKNGDLFQSDWLISAWLLCVIALLTLPQSILFGVMFLIAAGQNLRYTYMSIPWINEAVRDRNIKRHDNSDDNVP